MDHLNVNLNELSLFGVSAINLFEYALNTLQVNNLSVSPFTCILRKHEATMVKHNRDKFGKTVDFSLF